MASDGEIEIHAGQQMIKRGLQKALVRTRRGIRNSDGLKYLLLLLKNLLLYALVLGFLLFEEVWEQLRNLLAFRKYYPRLMTAVNAFAARRNRYLVLAIYLSLFVPMELLGLASAALATKGLWKSAILVYASKGLLAVPAIDIFVANKDKLLSFYLVNKGYEWLLFLKQSEIYRSVLARMRHARIHLRSLSRRFLSWLR